MEQNENVKGRYPFSGISIAVRERLGKGLTRLAWPTAAGMGVAVAVMEHNHVLGVTGDIFESPQTALFALPPVVVWATGKIMAESAEVETQNNIDNRGEV